MYKKILKIFAVFLIYSFLTLNSFAANVVKVDKVKLDKEKYTFIKKENKQKTIIDSTITFNKIKKLKSSNAYIVKKDGKYGIYTVLNWIMNNGDIKEIIPIEYNSIEDKGDKIFVLKKENNTMMAYVKIDSYNNDFTSNLLPDNAKILKKENDKYIVKKDNLLGFYNHDFRELLPIKYKNIEYKKNNIVFADGKYGIILENKPVELIYDDIKGINKYYIARKDKNYFIIDSSNETTKSILADEIIHLKDNFYKRKLKDKYQIFMLPDKELTGFVYDDIDINVVNNIDTSNDDNKKIYGNFDFLLFAKKENEEHIIKIKNENIEIIKNPSKGKLFTSTKAGIVYKKDEKYGLIDYSGDQILNNEYDLIYNPNFNETSNYLFLKKADKYAVYSFNNQEMSDFKYKSVYVNKKSKIIAKNQKGFKNDIYNKTAANKRYKAHYRDIAQITIYNSLYYLFQYFPPALVVFPLGAFFLLGTSAPYSDACKLPKHKEYPKAYFD